MVPREYTNNAYAKSWGTTKSIMVFFRNGFYSVLSNRARIREQIPGITGIRVRIAMRGRTAEVVLCCSGHYVDPTYY